MPTKKKQGKKKPKAKPKKKVAKKKPPTNAEIMREGAKVLAQGLSAVFKEARKGTESMRSRAGWGRKNDR